MNLHFDEKDLQTLIRQVVGEVLSSLDWPQGRLCLTEAEAAQSCGVRRHVLRDLRINGRIPFLRVGRRIVYTRQDILAAFQFFREP